MKRRIYPAVSTNGRYEDSRTTDYDFLLHKLIARCDPAQEYCSRPELGRVLA